MESLGRDRETSAVSVVCVDRDLPDHGWHRVCFERGRTANERKELAMNPEMLSIFGGATAIEENLPPELPSFVHPDYEAACGGHLPGVRMAGG